MPGHIDILFVMIEVLYSPDTTVQANTPRPPPRALLPTPKPKYFHRRNPTYDPRYVLYA